MCLLGFFNELSLDSSEELILTILSKLNSLGCVE